MKIFSAAKSLGVWIIIFLVMVILANFAYTPNLNKVIDKLSYSEFTERVVKGEIASVEIQGQNVTGETTDHKRFETFVPEDAGLVQLLTDHKVHISAVPVSDPGESWSGILIAWLPMIFFLGISRITQKFPINNCK